ncbi:MAG: MEKHLA domain-containing protein [Sideroxyarcus sp.]|nr:MEKHLA domain-containing protein [Sideroxyarcus sp.]
MPSSKLSDAVPDECLRLLVESYHRLTGKQLLEGVPVDIAALRIAVWNAPRAIVAHGTEDDPLFFYGNRLALQLFEMSFAEFTQLPSRLSAEPLAQEAREKLLAKVTQQGYVDNYSGLRIASSGRRFMITDCTVWNLADEQGGYHGQAAVFVAAP